jgi:hypothetical protein
MLFFFVAAGCAAMLGGVARLGGPRILHMENRTT